VRGVEPSDADRGGAASDALNSTHEGAPIVPPVDQRQSTETPRIERSAAIVLDLAEPALTPAGSVYSPSKRCSGSRMLPFECVVHPSPIPEAVPNHQGGDDAPAMNNQVSPLGRVHAMSMIAPWRRNHQFGTQ